MGKVVFVDPSWAIPESVEPPHGEGHHGLFFLLEDHGYSRLQDSYTVNGPTDMPSTLVSARAPRRKKDGVVLARVRYRRRRAS